MAYSELVKNFDRIREYMRQFYVFGFKSRTEYDRRSARSYDNERRRLESWLGDFMRFRTNAEGKNVFLSVDSRSIPGNPLYNAFKAKSFTAGDVTFHFYILDLLSDGSAYTARQLLDLLLEKYLCHFDSWQPDISTIRKKLSEYVTLGILTVSKQGKELLYRRNEDRIDLDKWAEAAAFYSEADPLGVIGSTLLDRLDSPPGHYRFKHHYILHALDSQLLLQLLTAIGERRSIKLTNVSRFRKKGSVVHTVCPLKIYISTQGGRQYLLCYHYRMRRLLFFRLDYVQAVELLSGESRFSLFQTNLERARSHLWGTSGGAGFTVEHLEMTLSFDDDEQHIPRRLEREKRNGTVELLDANTCRYSVDCYDASELLPWIRTFMGRIEKLECSNPTVLERFYGDLDQTWAMYGGDA